LIKTERTTLRRFTEADLEAFFRMGSDPDVVRYTADPGGGFRDRNHALEILRAHPLADYEKYGFGRMAVELATTGEVAGFAGLKFLPEFEEVDLAYRFFPEHWGKGLATETARASLGYGFGELDLEEIVAFALPANTGSVHVLEKLGFTKTGTIDYDGHEAWRYLIRNSASRG
jgi:RimJ/RimL family protein N-acetyltransferase